jgi:hypothetical protein
LVSISASFLFSVSAMEINNRDKRVIRDIVLFCRNNLSKESIKLLNEAHGLMVDANYWQEYFEVALELDNARFWLSQYLDARRLKLDDIEKNTYLGQYFVALHNKVLDSVLEINQITQIV